MTAPSAKINLPEVIEDFAAYYEVHTSWGSLHVVLADGNYDQAVAEGCVRWAAEQGDTEGERLARILCDLSYSQRARLPRKVYQLVHSRAMQRRVSNG